MLNEIVLEEPMIVLDVVKKVDKYALVITEIHRNWRHIEVHQVVLLHWDPKSLVYIFKLLQKSLVLVENSYLEKSGVKKG